MGRAMIRPIFQQIRSWDPSISRELSLALRWWQEVLAMGICEHREWNKNASRPLHLFSDARSTPPRIAAVLLGEGSIQYADMQPDEQTLDCFKRGGDGQIMSLELLSIALGCCLVCISYGWCVLVFAMQAYQCGPRTWQARMLSFILTTQAQRQRPVMALHVLCSFGFVLLSVSCSSKALLPISIRVPWFMPCGASLLSCASVSGWCACPRQRTLLIRLPGRLCFALLERSWCLVG